MATTNEQTAIVPVEGNAFALMDRLDDMQTLASVDPTYAAKMVAGLRPDTLVYIIPSKSGDIVGISVTGAQVLAGRRGGFETLADYRLDEIVTQIMVTVGFEEKVGRNGPYKAPIKEPQDARAIRLFVRVHDKRNDTTFIGVSEQALDMAMRDGSTEADPHAFTKAFNKAERNAIRKHFAAFESMVVDFAQDAKKSGKAFVTGAVDEDDLAAAAEVRGNVRKLDMQGAEKMGPDRANGFKRRRAAIIAQYGLDTATLAERSKQYIQRTYGASKLDDVPAEAEAALYEWLENQIPADQRGLTEEQIDAAGGPEGVAARAKPVMDAMQAVREEALEEAAAIGTPPVKAKREAAAPASPPAEPSDDLPDEAAMREEFLDLAGSKGSLPRSEAQKKWAALQGPDEQMAALEAARDKAGEQPGLIE